MNQERDYLSEVESVSPSELARMIAHPTAAEARVLRAYFGGPRFDRLQQLATAPQLAAEPSGNVVVIPGLMGSALTAQERGGKLTEVWLSYWGLHRGRLRHLRLAANGRDAIDPRTLIRPHGVLKQYYAELGLTLLKNGWNVREFDYDWRLDLDQAADALSNRATGWFGPSAPFHIVAHSMGGLVARAFVKRHPARWKVAPPGPEGGRLVTLGTPHHGAFLIPQALTGLARTIWMLERLDFKHDMAGVLEIVDSFPGVYQMLPSPLLLPEVEPLYQAGSYTGLPVSQTHCDRARAMHDLLADVIDPSRMIAVVGYGQPTVAGIRDFAHLRDLKSYVINHNGDGSVPLALGVLRGRDGSAAALPTYFFKEEHSKLASNTGVLAVVDEVLRGGTASSPMAPAAISLATDAARSAATMATKDSPAARRQWLLEREATQKRLNGLLRRLNAKAPKAGATPLKVAPEEHEIVALIAGEFIGAHSPAPMARPAAAARSNPKSKPKSTAKSKSPIARKATGAKPAKKPKSKPKATGKKAALKAGPKVASKARRKPTS